MGKVVIPKDIVVEPFLTDDESKQLVRKIFIGIGLMMVASAMSFLFYWSYNKSRSIFIMIIGILMLAYSLEMILLTYKIREKLDNTYFYLYMGSSIVMTFISVSVLVFFAIKVIMENKASSGYVPSGIQSYGNQPYGNQ